MKSSHSVRLFWDLRIWDINFAQYIPWDVLEMKLSPLHHSYGLFLYWKIRCDAGVCSQVDLENANWPGNLAEEQQEGKETPEMQTLLEKTTRNPPILQKHTSRLVDITVVTTHMSRSLTDVLHTPDHRTEPIEGSKYLLWIPALWCSISNTSFIRS